MSAWPWCTSVCACSERDIWSRSISRKAMAACMGGLTTPKFSIACDVLETMMRPALMIAVAAVLTVSDASAQEVTVRVGNALSIASGALLIAIERGYFREVGIKVVIDPLDSAANAIALLAQNQFQIIEGGLAAGYFNALEKNLPITIAMSRVSTPLGHNMMLRADLKDQIKDIKQLKGRVIATNGPGSVSTYEIGKMLETAGLTMSEVDLKVIPF